MCPPSLPPSLYFLSITFSHLFHVKLTREGWAAWPGSSGSPRVRRLREASAPLTTGPAGCGQGSMSARPCGRLYGQGPKLEPGLVPGPLVAPLPVQPSSTCEGVGCARNLCRREGSGHTSGQWRLPGEESNSSSRPARTSWAGTWCVRQFFASVPSAACHPTGLATLWGRQLMRGGGASTGCFLTCALPCACISHCYALPFTACPESAGCQCKQGEWLSDMSWA